MEQEQKFRKFAISTLLILKDIKLATQILGLNPINIKRRIGLASEPHATPKFELDNRILNKMLKQGLNPCKAFYHYKENKLFFLTEKQEKKLLEFFFNQEELFRLQENSDITENINFLSYNVGIELALQCMSFHTGLCTQELQDLLED